jgi:predicted ATP-dependent serine protease
MSDWFDNLNPADYDEYECSECGESMQSDKGQCSSTCFNASMR